MFENWNFRIALYRPVTNAILIAILGLFVSPSVRPAYSDDSTFVLDMNYSEIQNRLGILTLRDLGVGDTAYIYGTSWPGICRISNNLMISADVKLATDRSEYSRYFQVKRLPSGKLSLKIVDHLGKNTLTAEQKATVFANSLWSDCEFTHLEKNCHSAGDCYLIDSIDGFKSASELIRDISANLPSDKTSLATKDKEDVFSKLDRMYANERRFSKKTSLIDDSTNLYISKYAVGDKNRKWPNYNHTMFIRCQENELNVYVTLDDRVYGDGGKVDVVYRLDRSPATTSKWIIGRENRSIFYPGNKKQVIQFVGNLIKHEKIFIRVSPSKKNHFDVEFNLEYLEEYAQKFPDDCEIPGTRNCAYPVNTHTH